MFNRILLFSIFVLLLGSLSGCYCRHKGDKQKSDVAGIIPLHNTSNTVSAHEARYIPSIYGDTMLVYVDDERLRMTPVGDVLDNMGNVYFSIGSVSPITSLYYSQRGRDFFVFYSTASLNDSRSCAARISLESKKIIWSTQINGQTVSCPVIHGQFAYISSTGFIGKMILKNGMFDWQFSNLQREGRYSRFNDVNVLGGNKVQFVSPQPFSFLNDTIVVNDISGEIIRMSL